MICKILSTEVAETYENVSSVSLPGWLGNFEILTNHAESFQLLKKGTVRVRWKGKKEVLKEIDGGSSYCNKNTILIMLGSK